MTKNYYVGGNTVRELEAPVRKPRESAEEIERRKREQRRRRAAERNRSRALGMSRGYVIFLTLGVLAMAYACVMWVQLQSDVTTHMRNIASLQSQVNSLRADNDEKYKRITTSVDLNKVKEKAINELGMSYPTQEQVVYFTIENSNFMDQYSDIPK